MINTIDLGAPPIMPPPEIHFIFLACTVPFIIFYLLKILSLLVFKDTRTSKVILGMVYAGFLSYVSILLLVAIELISPLYGYGPMRVAYLLMVVGINTAFDTFFLFWRLKSKYTYLYVLLFAISNLAFWFFLLRTIRLLFGIY